MTRILLDIIHRVLPPAPWSEGEKIPWHDPAFSARMLREHLSQAHDAASRRGDRVAAHVRWIHEHLLHGQHTRVLDLACGPGLYTARLAALGHACVGIDVAPAAIDHARQAAADTRLACTYRLADIRTADYGGGYGLVMLLFGELNVFSPVDAQVIVAKARRALVVGGLLLLEVHTAAAIRRMGEAPPTWRSAEQGLFSPRPHLRLEESFWDNERQVATHRYLIVDAATAAVDWHAESVQSYSDDAYRSLLHDGGFLLHDARPSLDGSGEAGDFIVLIGRAGA
jgi:SAM-dependent methyltransferase